MAVTAQTNNYNGNLSVSVQIKSIRRAKTDDQKLFSDIENYNLYKNNKEFNANSITPNRIEVGEVYRYISQNGILAEKVNYHFINTLGFGKTSVSLEVLEDLGLIYLKGGLYYKNQTSEKTNLQNSNIYNKLLKECEHS